MPNNENDDKLLEEFEEAKEEYEENVYNKTFDDELIPEVEQNSNTNEQPEEIQVENESVDNNEENQSNEEQPKETNNSNKWIIALAGLSGILLIALIIVLVNNKTDELLIAKNNYKESQEKIKQLEEKINKMSDQQKEIAGVEVNKEEEKKQELIDKKKEENKTDEYKRYEKLSDEEKEKQEVVPREENIPIEDLDKIKEEENFDDSEKIPAKFDLRDKIQIEVEDQGDYSLCWAFASATSLQTHYALKNKGTINVSKMHVDYLMSNNIYGVRDVHDGGNFGDFEAYLSLTNPVETKTLGYKDYSDINSIDYFLDLETSDVRVTSTVHFPNVYKDEDMSEEEYQQQRLEIIKTVKQHIMKNGSVNTIILSPNIFSNYVYNNGKSFAMYFNGNYDMLGENYGYHIVSIVGWDDNYSKNNFNPKMKPNNDGAFLVLNSWGKEYGQDGYFYISYEDALVLNDMNGISSISLDDAIKLDSIKNKAIRNILDEQVSYSYFSEKGETYVPKYVFSKITDLDLSNGGFTNDDADLIKLFDKLYSIDLSNNDLTDISFIKNNPNIISIDLSNNKIEDLSPLKDTGITSIDASNNKIKDVSYLESLNDLNYINLSGNNGVIGFDKLKSLYILELMDTNADLSNITNLTNLSVLNISNNDISTLPKDLSDFDSLNSLSMINCNIKSINDLPYIKNDEHSLNINLDGNIISDISNINSKIDNVSMMSLNNNGISDIKKINNIKADYLYLKYNNISNIKDFANKNISLLDLSNNKISDLKGFKSYNLVSINLSGNKNIKNLTALNNGKIESLSLDDIGLDNMNEISKLTNIMTLSLDNNNIVDISKINDMKKLLGISLENNKVLNANISNKTLETINLANNKLESLSINDSENLFYVNIENNNDIKNLGNNININNDYSILSGEGIVLDDNQTTEIAKTMSESNVEFYKFTLEYKEKGLSDKMTINNPEIRRSLLSNIFYPNIKNGRVDSKARTLEILDSSKDVEVEVDSFSVNDYNFYFPTLLLR